MTMKEPVLPRLRYDPLPFLMSDRQPPWIKYQTLVRLLKRPQEDAEVAHWRAMRDASAEVRRIRQRQGTEGWFPGMPWMHIHEYPFIRLLDMGYGLEDETVRRTADHLLQYQLPEGGYMHPAGRKVNIPTSRVGWGACVSGYVTKALMDLGLMEHPAVQTSLHVMLGRQRKTGGWICRHHQDRFPYCILGGTPWVFACLARAGLLTRRSGVTTRALAVFFRHKEKIIRHGYQKDRCYRCDEPLLLPSLHKVGVSHRHPLFRHLRASLLGKQRQDGGWPFGGKYSVQRSGWYSIECIAALQAVDS
jgi:hypothetical protein